MTTKRQRASLCPSEHDEQKMVIRWCLELSPLGLRPLTSLIAAVPNESKTGNRDKLGGIIRGKRLKAEGRRKGFPDLILAVPRQRVEFRDTEHGSMAFWLWYHSLFIEMKRRDEAFEYPSAEQLAWHRELRLQGMAVVVAAGSEIAIDAITKYLNGESLEPVA